MTTNKDDLARALQFAERAELQARKELAAAEARFAEDA